MTDVTTGNGQAETTPAPIRPKQRNEDRHAKFKRIASRRTQQVLVALGRLQACGSAAYDYTDGEAAHILSTIHDALSKVEAAFTQRKKVSTDFRL